LKEAEVRLLDLMRAVCQAYRRDRGQGVNSILRSLQEGGFGEVSVAFVQTVFDQLKKGVDKHLEPLRKNSQKLAYYDIGSRKGINDNYFVWSDRYILIAADVWTQHFCYYLELFDTYNAKFV
jgi:hypothetical protein